MRTRSGGIAIPGETEARHEARRLAIQPLYMPQPTVESYLSAIVFEQKQSGMNPLEFYKALHRFARQTHLLQTVLIRSTFTVGVPNAADGSKPIEIAAPEVIPLCLLKN